MAWVNHHPLPKGYWGDITSSLIWCEEKYRWSKYVAEPVNTFTNVFFFLLALHGAKNTFEERLPVRFLLVNLGIAGIGVGSFLFHATLKYEAQLLDELPMIYTSALLTYCVLETSPGYGKPRFKILLPALLTLLVSFITIGYIYLGNPVFHQVAYGLIQFTSTVQIVTLLWAGKGSRSPFTTSPKGIETKKQIQEIFTFGSVLFMTAFAIWNVDNVYCSQLRALRHKIGFPFEIFLEGHAWWHIGTGWGAYWILVASELLVLSLKEEPENFILIRDGSFHSWVPYVKRVKNWNGPNKDYETRTKKRGKEKSNSSLEDRSIANGTVSVTPQTSYKKIQ